MPTPIQLTQFNTVDTQGCSEMCTGEFTVQLHTQSPTDQNFVHYLASQQKTSITTLTKCKSVINCKPLLVVAICRSFLFEYKGTKVKTVQRMDHDCINNGITAVEGPTWQLRLPSLRCSMKRQSQEDTQQAACTSHILIHLRCQTVQSFT